MLKLNCFAAVAAVLIIAPLHAQDVHVRVSPNFKINHSRHR